MKRTFLRPLAVAACLVTPLALSACVSSERSQSGGEQISECPWEGDDSVSGDVTIGWQRIPNGDLIVKDQGLLEACMPNVNIKWTPYDSGADVVKAYTGGTLDLSLIGNSPAVTAMSPPNNADVDVVWIHDVIGKAESLLARDDKVTSLQQLKGKTIGVPEGSTSHYSLVQAILKLGLDPDKDYKIINLQPDSMPAAWSSGDVDAVWVWDPTKSKLLEDGGHAVMSSADTAKQGYATYDLGTASAEFVKENPEFMAQWVQAEDYAVKMINDDPAKASEIIGAVLQLPAADIQKQFAGYEYLDASEQASPKYLGGEMSKDLENTAKFLITQASIDSALTPAQYAQHVDSKPAEEAAK